MILEEHLETTVKVHDQQLHRRVDLLLRTGKLLVESLADTNRIVKNMKRTAGIPEEKLHINVSFTMLMVNVSDGDYSFTKFQRIEGHGVNMTAISEVSKLSWRASSRIPYLSRDSFFASSGLTRFGFFFRFLQIIP